MPQAPEFVEQGYVWKCHSDYRPPGSRRLYNALALPEQCVPTLVPQLSAAMLPVALALRQMCGGNF